MTANEHMNPEWLTVPYMILSETSGSPAHSSQISNVKAVALMSSSFSHLKDRFL